MHHLSTILNPRDAGLTPFVVRFTCAASGPVRSLLDDGLWYVHPAQEETATVWAKEEAGIAAVLTYHYRRSWSQHTVLSTVA